ncbi:MAG TPA: hypothetical protein VF035_01445 [Longimicrobiales bacterium]
MSTRISEGTSSAAGDAEAPRAYYPDYAGRGPDWQQTPGWDLATERQITDGRTMARGLGWFSIGLGLLEVFAPTKVTEFLGVDDKHAHLVQFYGMREIASGIAVLSERTPVKGMWSRVGGDAIDLATLASFTAQTDRPGNVMMALGMVAGVTAMDMKCAVQLGELPDADGGRRRAA